MSEVRMVRRLRRIVLAMAIVLTFAAFAAPVAVVVYVQESVQATQVILDCSTIRANITQLRALRTISRTLGLPAEFRIPVYPEECP